LVLGPQLDLAATVFGGVKDQAVHGSRSAVLWRTNFVLPRKRSRRLWGNGKW